jgi:hypothetical protein
VSERNGGSKPPHARRRPGHAGASLEAERTLRGYRAVETIYHAYLTGLILMVVSRRGAGDAAELVFRLFRRQQLEKFLPGLDKLGLRGLPHAVACAQYHYLSNDLGGVRVEYVYESDRKAWVRYVPPRWMYDGTAICGVPTEVSRAVLRGWHANNGVLLGNPRLGFVCTKQTTDGQPGLEGYYFEHDRDLAPDERLRFAPDEDGPDFDPIDAPRLDSATWPPERLARASRNYSMAYVRTILPELVDLFGSAEALRLGGLAARQIGMQFYPATADLLGVEPGGAAGFARYLTAMGRAQGDDTSEIGDSGASQTTWRLMAGLDALASAAFDVWNELWVGALSIHDRHLRLEVTRRLDAGEGRVEWRIVPRGRR